MSDRSCNGYYKDIIEQALARFLVRVLKVISF